MYDINTVCVSGNLCCQPTFSEIGNSGVLNFQIANDSKKCKMGVWSKYTNFFSISVFGEKSIWLRDNLKIGSRVVVCGQLNYSQWKNNDGELKNKIEILANNVVVVSLKNLKEKENEE